MEHVLHAARAGRIAKLAVKEGEQVTQGALIAALAEMIVIPDDAISVDPGPSTYARPLARSPDWMRLTPAFSMFFQAAASEPWVSMPRQASSIT